MKKLKPLLFFAVLLVCTLMLFACDSAGSNESEETTAVHEHVIVVDEAVATTCSETGLTEGSHCSVCNEVIVEQTIINKLQHAYNNWAITREATCTGNGMQSRACKNCGYIETESMSAVGHAESIDLAVPATCTTDGKTQGKHCSVCNEIIEAQTVIPAAHTVVIDNQAKNATCTEIGYTETSHCSLCNIVISDNKEIPALGHNYVVDAAKTATCTTSGLTEGSHCSNCNLVSKKQETIPALGHTVVKDEAVPATCQSTGLTEGTHCSVCNAVLTEQNTIPKNNTHTYTSGVCTYCGCQDPNYTAEFSAGEKWIVDGQWEISFDNAIQTVIKDGKQTIQLTWRYKNIGYSGKLNISMWDYDLYDSEMEINTEWTAFDVDCNNNTGVDCIVGAKATCSMGWILNNYSTQIRVYLELRDSNKNTHKATFVLDVVLSKEDDSDKLEGCTINLGTSLPQTISYYKSGGNKQSSCSVTDISFEVSGDDLYIYFTGRKTYDSRGSGQSDSCKIGWKLYDSNNNVIATGTAYTLSLAVGEGFVKTKDTAYNCITAGGTYKLVLLNVN